MRDALASSRPGKQQLLSHLPSVHLLFGDPYLDTAASLSSGQTESSPPHSLAHSVQSMFALLPGLRSCSLGLKFAQGSQGRRL